MFENQKKKRKYGNKRYFYINICYLVPVWLGWWRGSVVRTSLFGWWTFPDLWLTCVSTVGQPTRPTQPSIPSGSVNE